MTQSTSGGFAPRLASNTETLGELSQDNPQAKERLVGAWKLVSCVGRWSDGRVTYPYGPNPVGLLVYTADGHFSGQMHSQGRPLFQSGNLSKGEPRKSKSHLKATLPTTAPTRWMRP